MASSPRDGVPSSTERLVEQLEDLVFSGLEPGEPLPSEGELARMLNVSRLTIREATKALQARGLLEIRQGRRPTVAAPSGAPVSDFFRTAIRRDPQATLELMDVRLALEVHIAGLAAKRATPAAIERMEAAIDGMRAGRDDEATFHEADIRFHQELANSTGNDLLALLIEGLREPLRESRRRSFNGGHARGKSIDSIIEQHSNVLEAVVARDARKASTAMRRHLRETQKDLRAITNAERSAAASIVASGGTA